MLDARRAQSRAAADDRWRPRARSLFSRRGRRAARALGLVGYARNRDDGTVEIVAEGERHALEILAAWAHRGPTSARVEDVQIEWSEPSDEFDKFSVR
jgi:acylphosphatase